jgi:large subunit ribosomal protein L34
MLNEKLLINCLTTRLNFMPKRTYQPNKKRALKKHGFRKRMQTKDGRTVIKKRKAKGRKTLTKKVSK